jgi:hypothetical protein
MEDQTYIYKKRMSVEQLRKEKQHLQRKLQTFDNAYPSARKRDPDAQVLHDLLKERNMLEAMLQEHPETPGVLIPIPSDSPARQTRLATLATQIDAAKQRLNDLSWVFPARKALVDDLEEVKEELEFWRDREATATQRVSVDVPALSPSPSPPQLQGCRPHQSLHRGPQPHPHHTQPSCYCALQ